MAAPVKFLKILNNLAGLPWPGFGPARKTLPGWRKRAPGLLKQQATKAKSWRGSS
jgi:hypothetical protein